MRRTGPDQQRHGERQWRRPQRRDHQRCQWPFNVTGTVTSDNTFDNSEATSGRTLAIMAAGDYTVDGAHHQQRRHHRGERCGVLNDRDVAG